MKAKIQNFLATLFTNNSEGIEKANRTLTDIMIDTAKHSLPMKRQKKYKTHKPKNGLTRNVRKQEKCLKG